MAAFLKRANPASQPSGRPHTAVEIAPEGVLVASLPSPNQHPVVAWTALPAGALVPGIAEANLRHPELVAQTLQTAIDRAAPKSRAVTLVVPDTTTRVFVLDFDTLPSKPAEAISVLRFRLRKMVPFDVEQAAVSYQFLGQTEPAEKRNEEGSVKVLAAIIPGAILAEYEAAVRAAGHEPGAVLPSSLAALAALDSMEPVLTANLAGTALTTTISTSLDLYLYRTVELPTEGNAWVTEIQRNITVAAAFYEDKLQARPRRLHYAGGLDPREFAQAIDNPELEVVEVAPLPSYGVATPVGSVSYAGVCGALAGVA